MPFVPPFNAPVEQSEFQRWVRDHLLALNTENEKLRAQIARMSKSETAGNRQTNVVNNEVRDLKRIVQGVNGLPVPGEDTWVLKWEGGTAGYPLWKPNTVGGLPAEYISLAPGGEAALAGLAEAKAINIALFPTADGDPFEITFPTMHDGDTGLDLPFFVLTVASYGFQADVTVSGAGAVPTYASNPGEYVNGSETLWQLPADYYGAWFVTCSYDAGRMAAVPIYDPWFTAEYGTPVNVSTAPTVATTADAGTGATATPTGTSLGGEVELVTGTSPTSTGWAELLTFTDGWTTGEAPALVLTPANEDAAALPFYVTRSGVEVQAWFDMTAIAASTTYRFHYSLLPAA